MRSKEFAEDYRFISEPDLPIINLEKGKIENLKSLLPVTPHEKIKKLIRKYKIEKKSAEILTKKLILQNFLRVL